jgi:LPXTG-site transpeptidase (sortase) family protein
VDVAGDGEVDSAQVKLARAGFYTYRERIVETPSVAATETACGEEIETALASPLILTGRGDRATSAQAGPPGDATTTAPPAAPAVAPPAPPAKAGPVAKPTRVRLASRGIDAPVYAVDIDTRSGALAIPKDIDRVAWWRDGAAPGSANGAILLAGHVDSAKRGAGAFYALKNARRGDNVAVTSDDGKTRDYRITSMVRVRKAALPASIYSRSGRRRLVLVTCGGPFDAARGHYRDNIIVTALPR